MRDERYTFEDYVKDFQFDHLGFDGVPEGPVPDPSPKIIPENGPEPNADGGPRSQQ